MSQPHSTLSEVHHVSTKPSNPIRISARAIAIHLFDIPSFSLGPSLYDYVHGSPDYTSSIGSGSPPHTPPPDPISTDHHSNQTSPNNSQRPTLLLKDNSLQADGHVHNEHEPFSSHMFHRDHLFKSGKNSLAGCAECPQVPSILATTTVMQDNNEANYLNPNVPGKDTMRKASTVSTSHPSSKQSQSAVYSSQKCNAKQIQTARHYFVDVQASKGSPIVHLGNSDGITKIREE